MSTPLKGTSGHTLTQFCGPARKDGGDRRKLQVSQRDAKFHGNNWKDAGFVNVTKEEALELATALLEWVQDTREEVLQ